MLRGVPLLIFARMQRKSAAARRIITEDAGRIPLREVLAVTEDFFLH